MEDPAPDPGCRLSELREALLTEDGLKHISRLVTIGELALCFSHEVRTPLTLLLGHAYMMNKALPEDDPMRPHSDNVYHNGLRMKGMIDSMLNFGRRREKSTERCAPEELIEEAVRVVGPYFDNFKNPPIALQMNVANDCPEVAIARWEMVHVLVNLLTNAADAMAQSCKRLVTISAQQQDQGIVRFDVADTGSGIASECAERVFAPFFTTKGECGNGLGLYIARCTVEHHGGSIALQTGSCGTVFTVCLPTR